MSGRVRIINGKGDFNDVPPTGADDHDLQSFSNDFIFNGGVVRPEDGEFLVEQSNTPGMSVTVAPGTVYVLNSSWTFDSFEPQFYVVTRDAEETLSISSNPSGLTRYDLICQSIDKVTTPDDTGSNVCDLFVEEGTPGSGQPATPDDMELLAVITVASGVTTILDANITDERRTIEIKENDPKVVTLADGSTPALDASLGDIFILLAAGNRTIAVPTNPKNGQKIVIRHEASGANRTLALNSGTGGFRFGTDVTGLTATTSGKIDYIGCIYNETDNKWDVVGVAKGF